MKKLLWIGDAGCPSGFARATHGILDLVSRRFSTTVLGLNYRGDPHEYPYPIYAAAPGGDGFGVGRLIWMCDRVQPELIVIQNDGWNIPIYTQMLKRFPEYAKIPVVAAVAVDGKNFRGSWLTDVDHAIFWTDFALKEARLGGYEGPASVIPLGVDTDVYHPKDRREVRQRVFNTNALDDAFIFGTVNRNQPRKRWDLTLRYFAALAKDRPYMYLFLHVAPTGDVGFDILELARYYGIEKQLIRAEPAPWYGVSEDRLSDTYNTFDVAVTTTQGEGFGLTVLEAMACGIPVIAPDWSALGDLFQDAANLIPCTSTAATIGITMPSAVIGGVPDEAAFIRAMRDMYEQPTIRESYARSALARAQSCRFSWSQIGRTWVEVLESVVIEVPVPVYREWQR